MSIFSRVRALCARVDAQEADIEGIRNAMSYLSEKLAGIEEDRRALQKVKKTAPASICYVPDYVPNKKKPVKKPAVRR